VAGDSASLLRQPDRLPELSPGLYIMRVKTVAAGPVAADTSEQAIPFCAFLADTGARQFAFYRGR